MITAASILSAVGEQLEIPVSEITSRSRVVHLVHARYMCAALIREARKYWALQRIAEVLNYKDHTSVIKALRHHRLLIAGDAGYRKDFLILEHALLAATPAHQS